MSKHDFRIASTGPLSRTRAVGKHTCTYIHWMYDVGIHVYLICGCLLESGRAGSPTICMM
jgi:hypothetical protein